MKLLFITFWNFDDAANNGIAKKITAQCRAFEKAGFSVDMTCCKNGRFILCPVGESPIDLCGTRRYTTRIAAARALKKYLAIHNRGYACIYLRYAQADYALVSLLKQLRKSCINVVEIPTYPYDKEFDHGLLRCSLFIDKLYRNKAASYTDRFVNFSGYTSIFSTPAICAENGIDPDICPLRLPDAEDGIIHMIAVAGFSPWHGYDRLLRGLASYKAKGGKRGVLLHMVGNGPSMNAYKNLVRELDLTNNVIFHGFLSGKALDDVFNRCELAVASLGIHRLGLPYSTSLKFYEYLIRGLPVITVGRGKALPALSPYMLRVPNDETPINLFSIISFRDALYNDNAPVDMPSAIRAAAIPYCSMDVTMQPVVEYFRKDHKE